MQTIEAPSSQEQNPNNEDLIVHYANTIASEGRPGRNEDDYFFDPSKKIFGVFDGMGGEKNAQWNSQTSSRIIKDLLNNQHHPFPRDAREILKNACNLANTAVYNENQGQGGTTATFGLLCETIEDTSQIVIAHVGDSRAYLYRNGELSKLTTDDNLAKSASSGVQDELDNVVDKIDLSPEARDLIETRQIITNSIGGSSVITPKIFFKTVFPNDLLILTTDGIHDNLTTTEISQIISQNSQNPELISQKLTSASLARSREGVFRSKPDDMTALVITFNKENK